MAKEAKMALLSLQFMKWIPNDAHDTAGERSNTVPQQNDNFHQELLGNHS